MTPGGHGGGGGPERSSPTAVTHENQWCRDAAVMSRQAWTTEPGILAGRLGVGRRRDQAEGEDQPLPMARNLAAACMSKQAWTSMPGQSRPVARRMK
ncbi:hypothetical protein SAMN05421595_2210 [Austwickia chelonae]|nr:hypothetical protein SAMN05421595_2210 [Austwickia chelonae]